MAAVAGLEYLLSFYACAPCYALLRPRTQPSRLPPSPCTSYPCCTAITLDSVPVFPGLCTRSWLSLWAGCALLQFIRALPCILYLVRRSGFEPVPCNTFLQEGLATPLASTYSAIAAYSAADSRHSPRHVRFRACVIRTESACEYPLPTSPGEGAWLLSNKLFD